MLCNLSQYGLRAGRILNKKPEVSVLVVNAELIPLVLEVDP